jgi:hypothetical protein
MVKLFHSNQSITDVAIALQKEEGGRMGMGLRMVISTSFNVTWQ